MYSMSKKRRNQSCTVNSELILHKTVIVLQRLPKLAWEPFFLNVLFYFSLACRKHGGLRGFGRPNMPYTRVLILQRSFQFKLQILPRHLSCSVPCLLVKHIHWLHRYSRSQGEKLPHVRTLRTTVLPVRSWLGEGWRHYDKENWASLLNNSLKWGMRPNTNLGYF